MITRWLCAIAALTLVGCDKPDFGQNKGPAPTSAQRPETPNAVPPAPPAPPAPAAEPGFGDVAFKTFRSGGTSVQFTTKNKVETWWSNMAGPTVHGTYEQNGPEIVVHWDPKYTNNGSSQERYHQMGPCSMARYDRTDRASGKVIEDTLIYQQREPRCDTVRVTK